MLSADFYEDDNDQAKSISVMRERKILIDIDDIPRYLNTKTTKY